MWKHFIRNCVLWGRIPMMNLIPVVVLIITLQSCAAVEYGPSLSSLTGVFVNWKGPDLFAVESGRKVRLENYPGLAATLPLISGDSTATSEQIFKERGISTVGEFLVEAPKGFGIIVVVQELKLRKTNRERNNPNATVSCSDYLQIADTIPDANGSNAKTEKICGTVLRDDLSLAPKGMLGPRTFRSPFGRIRVAFNHAYVAELVDSLLGSKQKHVLKAEITFTSYKVGCRTDALVVPTNSTEVPIVEEETFEACTDYTKSSNQTCISSKLLCDDIYNCGGDSVTLGSDDITSCPDKPIRTTETPPADEGEGEDQQDGLTNLANYLGIPSLSSYTTKKYERRFRPSYVSSQQSSGSGFLFDYTSKRPSETAVVVSSTTEATPGGAIEINVVGPRDPKSSNIIVGSNSNEASEVDLETEIYSRRELSHAINSVIYGVAVFIIFTIFITVFVVCLTKKIQTSWTARIEERRRSSVDPEATRRRISTPSIIPNFTTTIINSQSRRASECDPGANGAQNAVVLALPQDLESYDPPPSYDALFPTPNRT